MKKIIALLLTFIMVLGTVSIFAEETTPFNDITNHWAEKEILAAYDAKIVNGDGTGAFRPNDTITRAEFVKMTSALVVTKMGVSDVPDEYKTEDNWYSKYVNFANTAYLLPDETNTINGVQPGIFTADNALAPIDRWEMAYISASLIDILLGATDISNVPEFSDMAEVEALQGNVPYGIKLAVSNGILNGTGGNKFSPMGVGTRAEAVVIVLRLSAKIDEFIADAETSQAEAYKKYEEEITSKLITYEEKDIPKSDVKIKFTMENEKSFTIELYPKTAPQTVANFVKLVSDGFYDGLTFHRVVDGFMAQGGDPKADGTGGSENYILGEFSSNNFESSAPLSHTRGVISMARSSHPNSASSQFFICYDDVSFLDGQYAAFGKVISGMDTVDSFLEVERTTNSAGELAIPKTPIVIKSVKIIK